MKRMPLSSKWNQLIQLTASPSLLPHAVSYLMHITFYLMHILFMNDVSCGHKMRNFGAKPKEPRFCLYFIVLCCAWFLKFQLFFIFNFFMITIRHKTYTCVTGLTNTLQKMKWNGVKCFRVCTHHCQLQFHT